MTVIACKRYNNTIKLAHAWVYGLAFMIPHKGNIRGITYIKNINTKEYSLVLSKPKYQIHIHRISIM